MLSEDIQLNTRVSVPEAKAMLGKLLNLDDAGLLEKIPILRGVDDNTTMIIKRGKTDPQASHIPSLVLEIAAYSSGNDRFLMITIAKKGDQIIIHDHEDAI